MSEQSKSNVQAIGAGVLGFVVVTAIGGGALMVRSSRPAEAPAMPVGAPIDLGSPMPSPAVSLIRAQKERRAQSPAPLIGDEDEPEESKEASVEISAAFPSIEAPPEEISRAPRLVVTRHLDREGSGSSAIAVVKNTAVDKVVETASKKTPPKLDPAGGGSTEMASVHYGVSDRRELMGRAAGPVRNFKGGGSGGTGGPTGGVGAEIGEIRRRLANVSLPADQRASLQKELDEAALDVSDAGPIQ